MFRLPPDVCVEAFPAPPHSRLHLGYIRAPQMLVRFFFIFYWRCFLSSVCNFYNAVGHACTDFSFSSLSLFFLLFFSFFLYVSLFTSLSLSILSVIFYLLSFVFLSAFLLLTNSFCNEYIAFFYIYSYTWLFTSHLINIHSCLSIF